MVSYDGIAPALSRVTPAVCVWLPVNCRVPDKLSTVPALVNGAPIVAVPLKPASLRSVAPVLLVNVPLPVNPSRHRPQPESVPKVMVALFTTAAPLPMLTAPQHPSWAH